MSSSARILVVEDEADLADLLGYNLKRVGYDTSVVYNGREAFESILKDPPDLVILDLSLPGLTGLEIAQRVRAEPSLHGVAILMLTARASEADQITGLKMGADDYVTKPFSNDVLLARVETLMRRRWSESGEAETIHAGPIKINLGTHEAEHEGELMKLTLTEFRLLVALIKAAGRVLSRSELMANAMGPGVLVTTRTIDVHVAAIRKKLGDSSEMIQTVRGVGYKLTPSNAPATSQG